MRVSLKETSPMKTHGALRSKLAFTLAVTLIFSLGGTTIWLGKAQDLPQYDTYVHNLVNTPPYGNWTYMEKPMFPVYFNQSQIQVGSNWTIISPLRANHTYHVYCYGNWTRQKLNPTDYDIYVYNPFGELVGYHTEAAGMPEHLGTTVNEPYFTAKQSGNYSFTLRNDPRESNSSRQATLMIIENVETDGWQQVYIKGMENNVPTFNTAWAFEFMTESQHIEVRIKVPDTLDMYEARLYLMANPDAGKGEMLNDVPLAWEPGLYGKTDQTFGGYNLESKAYRGNAYASCEHYGQNMLINYTSPVKSKSLYHLTFIGEKGEGTINFLVKTQFGLAQLKPINPPLRIYPNDNTTLTFASNMSDLKSAAFNYSVNKWVSYTILNMQLINNRTCWATVPGQAAGTVVTYQVQAADVLENILTYRGNYTVKNASQLNLTLKSDAISIGENITIIGRVTPQVENLTVTLVFTSTNGTFEQTVYTVGNGAILSSFKPTKQGNWQVQAIFEGDNTSYGNSSKSVEFKVNPPSFLSQFSIYIYAGAGAGGMIIAALVYVKKRRE